MKLTIELLSVNDMSHSITEDYDNEGCCHRVSGFWMSLWDSFMIVIHFMKEVRRRIKKEKLEK